MCFNDFDNGFVTTTAGLEVEKKKCRYDIGYAFFGAETLRAKPEPRARSARASRA